MIMGGNDARKRELNDGAAAPAYIRLKPLRPLMYAGQGPVLRVESMELMSEKRLVT